MEELFDDIVQRWVRAFDEFGDLDHYKSLVRTTKYATGYRYALEYYDPAHFPPGGELYEKMPLDAETPYEYGFDVSDRPVYEKSWSAYSDYSVQGCFNYSDSRIEHIEFGMDTETPTSIQVLQFTDGRKTAFQSLSLNGGGRGMPRKDAIISTVKAFSYEGDRISGAQCLAVMPGIGRFTYEEVYTYDKEGVLEEITEVFEDGRRQVSYARVAPDQEEH